MYLKSTYMQEFMLKNLKNQPPLWQTQEHIFFPIGMKLKIAGHPSDRIPCFKYSIG